MQDGSGRSVGYATPADLESRTRTHSDIFSQRHYVKHISFLVVIFMYFRSLLVYVRVEIEGVDAN